MGESDIRIEATAKAIACRSAMWGGQPCNPKGGCPFGRKTPQKPSELHSMCKDVTADMWEAVAEAELLARNCRQAPAWADCRHYRACPFAKEDGSLPRCSRVTARMWLRVIEQEAERSV